MMMRRKSADNCSTISSSSQEDGMEWEMRPGGMLVQKRSKIPVVSSPPSFRLRITFGALRFEISVSSQATFGELKKLLTSGTGLQPVDQRVIYRGRERENTEYLDKCGVKHRSKVIVIEEPISIEKRFIEMRRNAKIQKIQTAISAASMEIDKLAEQVSAVEKSVASGIKVAEVQISTLIELLMRQAIKLDGIPEEADVLRLKNLQGKRVQKCVETLDEVKVRNAKVRPVIVTNKWEIFDHPHPPSPFTTQWEFFE